MNESELDSERARQPPDYKVARAALFLSRCTDIANAAGMDFDVFERVRLLTEEIYQAICMRGARVNELVDAMRGVRPNGSILDDLPCSTEEVPTIRAKPPMSDR